MSTVRARLTPIQNITINEDLTTYTLYPGDLNRLPIITKEIGSFFTPLVLKNTLPGPYVDEFNSITSIKGQRLELQIEAFNEVDVQDGVVVSGTGAQNLTYTWKKDGITIQSNLSRVVSENKIIFSALQEGDSGTYSCEVSNDVGITTSDQLILNVVDPIGNDSFFTNLVQNPTGDQNLLFWTEVSAGGGEITVSKLKDDTEGNFYTDNPNQNADIRGYAYPTHFNEAELSDGPFIATDELSANAPTDKKVSNEELLGNLSFFTRSRIKPYNNNGSKKVQLVQDVDLSEVVNFINGSVYGVRGVQANFQCFLGSSISYFLTKSGLQGQPRFLVDSFGFLRSLQYPRLRQENKGVVEPRYEDQTNVYIEEFSNNTKIRVHKPLWDPYRTSASPQQVVLPNGASYLTGFLNYENAENPADRIGNDENLFDFFENYGIDANTSNLGQLIFLRKKEIETLDKRTNKIRIRVEFIHDGFQQFEFDTPNTLNPKFNSREILLTPSFQQDRQGNFIVGTYKFKASELDQASTPADVLPLYGQPRHLAAGFYLQLAPV